MKVSPCVFLFCSPLLGSLHADVIGGGAVDLDFVDIGNGGNAADNTGFGTVGYEFRISAFEVSQAMVDAYNSLSGGPAISYHDMTGYGGNAPDEPASGVSWNEAARFVNWLNTSAGYAPAYKFTSGGYNDNIELWSAGDAGYDPANPYRNSNAFYFLPTEDEWYKAAYYDPSANAGSGGYWNYATGSDSAPATVASGTISGTSVYGQVQAAGPAPITNAGGVSPYGTMAQNGNVFEWMESAVDGSNNLVDENRAYRGGKWDNTFAPLRSDERADRPPTVENRNVGFRVASVAVVPEPSSALLLGLGALSLLARRSRRGQG